MRQVGPHRSRLVRRPLTHLLFKTIVYIPEKQEPELMYKIFDKVVGSIEGILEAI